MTRPNSRSHRSLRVSVASIAGVFSGARACAAAAETGRRPTDLALSAVGIDIASWDRIGRR